jgi:hypothetical protein
MLSALIVRWDRATWSIVPSPRLDNVNFYPFGVDTKGAGSAVLAGWVDNGLESRTLSERWNGTLWKDVRSPNVRGVNDYLYDVTLGPGGNGWAVGTIRTWFSGMSETLIERFSGGSWTIDDGADVPGGSNELRGVDIGPNGEVWAVGHHTPEGQPDLTLVEHLCP